MRILQIGLGDNPGGVESFVMDYYRELVKQRIQFDFICMYPKLAYEDEIKSMGGTVFHTSNVKRHPFKFMRQLRYILLHRKYEAVHVNMLSAANIVPLIAARTAGVKKVVAHSHNSSSPGIVRNLLHRLNKVFVLIFSNYYFACSQVAAEWLFGKRLVEKNKIHYINNAIDVNKFLFSLEVRQNVRRELGLDDKFIVGHVGRFEEQKNHNFLIEVFQQVYKQKENAVLLLIGDGELKSTMEEKAKKLGVEKNIVFLGVRKDVEKLWQAMDVFVLPSLFEGLPIVAVEAQAANLPCVFSDTITDKVQIAGKINFLSLHDTSRKWAQAVICAGMDLRKPEQNQKIKEQFRCAGYDVSYESKKLADFYSK